MKVVCRIVICGALAASLSAQAAPAETEKQRKDDLVTLYMMSLAADRCGFPMTAQQADTVDRTAKSLAQSLRLSETQADAVYSDADVALEKQGPRACDRNGNFAKLYKETLQKLTGR
jgi:hypothetical protein